MLCHLAAALLDLVGREVTASVQPPAGRTVAMVCGTLDRGLEIPWRRDDVLVVMVGAGSVLIKADDVDEVDRWSFRVSGESYRSVCVYLKDGTSLLIEEDISQASA